MLEDDINLIIEKYSNYVYKIIDNIIKNTYNKFLNEEIKRNRKKKKLLLYYVFVHFYWLVQSQLMPQQIME